MVYNDEPTKELSLMPVLTNNHPYMEDMSMAKRILTQKQKTCKVLDCVNPHSSHGYCAKHSRQMLVHGKIFKKTRKDPNEIICVGGICRIILTDVSGNPIATAIIDREDRNRIEKYRWYKSGAYVKNNKIGYLHNFLLYRNANRKHVPDHKNRNTLDCRKNNLRIVSNSFNMMNSKKRKHNNSGYKGVYWEKDSKKWKAQIMVMYKEMNLGRFDDPKKAAKAYNEAAERHFGECAYLNPI